LRRPAAALLLQARARLVVDLSSDADLVARASADLQAFAPVEKAPPVGAN
jgi:hypothetical protein